ncbi:MAG: tetratricopeptide repeat protein [Draconibacterium sp.]
MKQNQISNKVSGKLLLLIMLVFTVNQAMAQKSILTMESMSAIADTINPQDTITSLQFCIELENVAATTSDSVLRCEALRVSGVVYGKMGRFGKAFEMLEKSVELAARLPVEKGNMVKAKALTNFGMLCQQNGDFGMALTKYLEAEQLYFIGNNIPGLIGIYSSLGDLYDKILQPEKRKEINEKAFNLSKQTNDTVAIIKAITGMATNLSNEDNYAEAIKMYKQALELSQKTGNKQLEHVAWYDLGFAWSRMDDYGKAEEMYTKSYEMALQTGNRMDIGDALYKMGLMSLYSGNLKQSEERLFEALEIAQSIQSKILERNVYDVLYTLEETRGNYKKAYEFLNNYVDVVYAIFSDDDQRQSNFLKARFDAEKREFVISKLESAKEIQQLKLARQRWLIFGLFLVLLFTGLMVLYIVKRNRYKQNLAEKRKQLQEQKIIQLEKEKQLIATRSLLAGEEIERTRLAGDLHDGLGGLLTGVKLKLSSMKENSIITSENLAHFNHALNLLDTSIAEMRRVAHNLMPETLMHYGLQTALADFVRQVEPEGLPVIRFNSFGENLRFEKELEITVYRITQELVNNALKHANAKLIEVQLFTEKNRVSLQVIDNGTGFNTNMATGQAAGKGLKNINDRITAFNGHFEIASEPGKGTECTLEFLIT